MYIKKDLLFLLEDEFISIDNIYFALHYLISNKNEYIVDKHGRKGSLINIKDLYLFQPSETNTVLSLRELQKTFVIDSISKLNYSNNANDTIIIHQIKIIHLNLKHHMNLRIVHKHLVKNQWKWK